MMKRCADITRRMRVRCIFTHQWCMNNDICISRWMPRWMDFRAMYSIRLDWNSYTQRECTYSMYACATLIPYVKWLSSLGRNFENAHEPNMQTPRFIRDSWKLFDHRQLSTSPHPPTLVDPPLFSRLRDPSQPNVRWTHEIGCSFWYSLTQLFVHTWGYKREANYFIANYSSVEFVT